MIINVLEFLKSCKLFVWCLFLAAVAASEHVAACPKDGLANACDMGTAGQIENKENSEHSALKMELLQTQKLYQGRKGQLQILSSHEPSSLATSGISTPPLLWGGLAYIKVPKTGGSTWAGVMRRLAIRHGLAHATDAAGGLEPLDDATELSIKWARQCVDNLSTQYEAFHAFDNFTFDKHQYVPDQSGPSVWADHGTRQNLVTYLDEMMPNAFYVTTIRDPVERAMSALYFFSSEPGREFEPTVELKVKCLDEGMPMDFQLDYIKAGPLQTPQEALLSYNFVGVTERFDESLLLLSRLLNVSTTDMLYLKEKDSGQNDQQSTYITQTHPPLEEEPDEVQRAAKNFQESDGEDIQLLKLANEQLDKLVQNYGSSFQNDLQVFTEKLAFVEKVCRPHSSESCLSKNIGCAQDCIDDLAKQQGWS